MENTQNFLNFICHYSFQKILTTTAVSLILTSCGSIVCYFSVNFENFYHCLGPLRTFITVWVLSGRSSLFGSSQNFHHCLDPLMTFRYLRSLKPLKRKTKFLVLDSVLFGMGDFSLLKPLVSFINENFRKRVFFSYLAPQN